MHPIFIINFFRVSCWKSRIQCMLFGTFGNNSSNCYNDAVNFNFAPSSSLFSYELSTKVNFFILCFSKYSLISLLNPILTDRVHLHIPFFSFYVLLTVRYMDSKRLMVIHFEKLWVCKYGSYQLR